MVTCKVCNGQGDFITTKTYDKCPCKLLQAKAFTLTQMVPEHLWEFKLETLKPCDVSRLAPQRQEGLIEKLKAHPDDSWAFFGGVSTGKTVFCTALLRHAIDRELDALWEATPMLRGFEYRVHHPESELPVVRISADILLRQHQDYAINRPITTERGEVIGGAAVPSITVKLIQNYARMGKRMRLFLEEIDKVELTKSRRDAMFSIVNALEENNGQLVFNTNLRKPEFAELYGAEFVVRLKRMCRLEDFYE